MMNECRDVSVLVNRLKRIEGQVRGVIKMIKEENACEDVLIQIGSAKSALQKTGQMVLETYVEQCVAKGVRDGNEEEAAKKVKAAIELFARIV